MLFSVVICTYNPDEKIFERVLESCLRQSFSDYEILIIDNNSSFSLENFKCISSHKERLRLITEKKQGLVFARFAGFNASNGKAIVFVDDDNILEPDYLKQASLLLENYNDVAVWGPGVISLDYPDGVPAWIDKHFSGLYQKKNFTEIRTGSEIEWQDYYPAGSGMIVRRDVFSNYRNAFERGEISATGRKGNSLASAEDSQIVWTAVKMGFRAGTSPDLKLTHVIPGKRTNLTYLKKLNYGISSSYYSALNEMFPAHKFPFKARGLAGKVKFAAKILLKARFMPLLFYRLLRVENAWPKAYEDFLKEKRRDQSLLS